MINEADDTRARDRRLAEAIGRFVTFEPNRRKPYVSRDVDGVYRASYETEFDAWAKNSPSTNAHAFVELLTWARRNKFDVQFCCDNTVRVVGLGQRDTRSFCETNPNPQEGFCVALDKALTARKGRKG